MDAVLADAPPPFAAEAAPGGAVSTGQYVTFTAGGKVYGIDIMSVREIRSWSPTTLLPAGPPGSRGVLDIRGSVVEIFDLAALLGDTPTEPGAGHIVLIIQFRDTQLGLMGESVSDIISAAPGDVRPAPMTGRQSGGRPERIAGLVKHEDRLVAILNPDGLFASTEQVWI